MCIIEGDNPNFDPFCNPHYRPLAYTIRLTLTQTGNKSCFTKPDSVVCVGFAVFFGSMFSMADNQVGHTGEAWRDESRDVDPAVYEALSPELTLTLTLSIALVLCRSGTLEQWLPRFI